MYMLMVLTVVVLVMEGGEWGWLKNSLITILFCGLFLLLLLLLLLLLFYRNKNVFKNLNSLKCVDYHLNKSLFRLTPENVGSYSRVFTVVHIFPRRSIISCT